MLRLAELENSLCEALRGQLGNIKIANRLRKNQKAERVSQRYILYLGISGSHSINDTSTSTVSKRLPRKIDYNLTFEFHLRDLRNHSTFYECADELLGKIDGLDVGLSFGSVSITSFNEAELDDDGYFTWTITGKLTQYSSIRRQTAINQI